MCSPLQVATSVTHHVASGGLRSLSHERFKAKDEAHWFIFCLGSRLDQSDVSLGYRIWPSKRSFTLKAPYERVNNGLFGISLNLYILKYDGKIKATNRWYGWSAVVQPFSLEGIQHFWNQKHRSAPKQFTVIASYPNTSACWGSSGGTIDSVIPPRTTRWALCWWRKPEGGCCFTDCGGPG